MNKNFISLFLLTLLTLIILVVKFSEVPKKDDSFSSIEEFRKLDLFQDLIFEQITSDLDKNIDSEIFANQKFFFTKAIKYFYIRKNNNVKIPFKIVYMSLKYNQSTIKKFIEISLQNEVTKDEILKSLDNISNKFIIKNYIVEIFQKESKRFGNVVEVHISKRTKIEE